MTFATWFTLLWRSALHIVHGWLTCHHSRALLAEGKTICPDCGHAVIGQWVILRCQGCHSRRDAVCLFRTVLPMDNFCTRCGEGATYLEMLENPEFYMLQKAVLMIQNEAEYLNQPRVSWMDPIRVWFEPPSKSPGYYRGLLTAGT